MARRPPPTGLAEFRRSGAVTELLFLYECTTRDIGQLRSVAAAMGTTVQATSHTFRSLARRGLAELRNGRYRPTVAGVAWMHSALGAAEEDLKERLERLHIVRTTYAVAAGPVAEGAPVQLSVVDGTLSARGGASGGSRGVARHRAGTGELVEVTDLEGIVPLRRGTVRVVVLPSERLRDPTLGTALARLVRASGPGLLAAHGPVAFHTLSRAVRDRAVVRFGVAGAVAEATPLGVDCTVVALDRDLPRLLNQLDGPQTPPVEFVSLGAGRAGRPRAR
jgi:putative transcriptional regulator